MHHFLIFKANVIIKAKHVLARLSQSQSFCFNLELATEWLDWLNN